MIMLNEIILNKNFKMFPACISGNFPTFKEREEMRKGGGFRCCGVLNILSYAKPYIRVPDHSHIPKFAHITWVVKKTFYR